jgi:cyclohexanecarboxylate-CoA ligase
MTKRKAGGRTEFDKYEDRAEGAGNRAPPPNQLTRVSLENFGLGYNELGCQQYYNSGRWDSTIIDDLARFWPVSPVKTALVTNFGENIRVDETFYSDLYILVNRIVGLWFESGVSTRDVGSIQLPNWWQFNVIFLATARIGAVLKAIIPVYRERDVSFMIQLCKMCLVQSIYSGFEYPTTRARVDSGLSSLRHSPLAQGERRPGCVLCEDDIMSYPWQASNKVFLAGSNPDPDQDSETLFTTGAMGEPKGIGQVRTTMFARARSIYQIMILSTDDLVWKPSARDHSTRFIYGCITLAILGINAICRDIWDQENAVAIIKSVKVTRSLSSTTFVIDLIGAPSGFPMYRSSLSYIASGGVAILPAVVEETIEIWRMTENGTAICTYFGEAELVGSDSDGLPLPWIELNIAQLASCKVIRLDSVGELTVGALSQMLRYVNRPQSNQEVLDAEGYFSKGDLARIYSRIHFRVVGWIKDRIISGSQNVPVAEIESLPCRHSGISEVTIAAYREEQLGKRVYAVAIQNLAMAVWREDLTAFLENAAMARVYRTRT